MDITYNTKESTNNLNSMKNKVNLFRKELYKNDKKFLEETNKIIDINNLYNPPEGRFTIPYKGVEFECLYKKNTESNRLYVIFSGSRKAGNIQPTFKRWSYYKYMDGSMLNIDDPTCKLYKELVLGWYYGTKNECYLDYIIEIVQSFALQNGIKSNDIVFFASSGGGYAALYCASKIKHSTAAVINPQIRLTLYDYAKWFQKITNINLLENDLFERNKLPELINQNKESRFIIIINIESDVDMVQLEELCKVLNESYNYGLTKLRDNILCWTYQAVSSMPHNAQEYPAMFMMIEHLINNFDKYNYLKNIYTLLSELWYDHYNLICQKNEVLNKKKKIELIKSCSIENEQYIMKTIQKHITNYIIPQSNSENNFKTFYNEFESFNLYEFVIDGINVLKGETEKISVIIYNSDISKIELKIDIPVVGGYRFLFRTKENIGNLKLNIYSGISGETKDISISCGIIILYKIQIL